MFYVNLFKVRGSRVESSNKGQNIARCFVFVCRASVRDEILLWLQYFRRVPEESLQILFNRAFSQ